MDELTGEPIFGLSVNLAVATQEGNKLEKYLDLTVRSLSQRSVTFNHNLTYQMSYSFWEKGKQTKSCVQAEFLNIFTVQKICKQRFKKKKKHFNGYSNIISQ